MSAVHGTSAGTTADRGTGAAGPADGPPADEGLDVQFARLKEAGSAWVAVKREQVAFRAKRVMLTAALGAGAAVVGVAVLAVSVFLLLAGLADLLANALQLRAGTASLIVGGGVLILTGLAAWIASRRLERGWSQRLRQSQPTTGTGSPA